MKVYNSTPRSCQFIQNSWLPSVANSGAAAKVREDALIFSNFEQVLVIGIPFSGNSGLSEGNPISLRSNRWSILYSVNVWRRSNIESCAGKELNTHLQVRYMGAKIKGFTNSLIWDSIIKIKFNCYPTITPNPSWEGDGKPRISMRQPSCLGI